MEKSKKRVAVLYGGMGLEHGVSLLGGRFVLKLIDRQKFDVLPILITKNGEWLWEQGKKSAPVFPIRRKGVGGILKRRRFIPIDAVFPILHGDFGEDGRIQGLLEALGISFVGCDTVTGAVCADKCFTKSAVHSLGIPTLPWISSSGKSQEDFCELCKNELGFPLFIKPTRLGSSVGAGIARDCMELHERVRFAWELDFGRVTAEKYLENPRELECAFLELGGKRHISPPGEIQIGGGFYDYSEKYSEKSTARVLTRAVLDEETDRKILAYTDKITSALGVKGLARVDFFLSGADLYFNEINTMPGMTSTSLYPRLAEGIGFNPQKLINGLISDVIGGEP